MLLHIVEWLIPGFVGSLYAQGVTREALARCINGSVCASLSVLVFVFFLIVCRRQVLRLFARLDTPTGFLGLLLVLSALSLPDPVRPYLPGLDNSWQWFLNRYALERIWGTQVVFTYGPLGFLITPLAWCWKSVLCALGANVLYQVLWVWGLCRLYKLSKDARWVAYGLAVSMFFPQSSMEWRWVVLAIVLTRTSWFAAGGVLALVSMIKFSALVTVAGTQVFLLAFGRGRGLCRFLSGFAMTFAVLATFLFDSPDSLIRWFKGSLMVAQGYNLNMLAEHGPVVLSLPVFFFAIAVRHPRNLMAFLPFFPLLFCTAKYSWVRQGVEPFLYALVVVMAFGLERLGVCRKKILLTMVAFLGIGYAFVWPRYFAGNTPCGFPFGINPMGVVRTITVADCFEKAARQSGMAVSDGALPVAMRSKIGSDTVQLLPNELSPAMSDSTLNLVPYPILQMYSTYTVGLDSLAAEFYRGLHAPTFIVLNLKDCTIDGKHLFLENPRTWMSIKENYELVGTEADLMLLQKRQLPKTVARDWNPEVPKISWTEKLRSLVFRGKICRAGFQSTVDGTRWFGRMNPEVLQEPIDGNLVVSPSGYSTYFRD